MAIFAIGDLQGCLTPLKKLLKKIAFDQSKDRLWLTGDLVNRGPESLETLRFVKALGSSAVTVLGNHDLHLISRHAGLSPIKTEPDLDRILDASDADELIRWLRFRPLLHFDPQLNCVMTHAGIFPGWSFDEARQCATELEDVLRRRDYRLFLSALYGDLPASWSDSHEGPDRLRFICNALTRMRFVDRNSGLSFTETNNPNSAPKTLKPWFKAKNRKNIEPRIIFGHWSTLGYLDSDNVLCLDTGCVWGRKMTAVRLDQPPFKPVSVACKF